MLFANKSNFLPIFITVRKRFCCFFAAEPNITSFTVTPDSVAKEGKKVTITCISKGVPYPNNDIFRNGTKVNTEKTSTEVSSEKTSTTYTIDSVTPGDAGIYTCIAKNKVGNDSATVDLTVQGKIKVLKALLQAHSITGRNAFGGTRKGKPCSINMYINGASSIL